MARIDARGRRKAIYEPVHGSAPDIAGTNAANPLGAVLSVALMLRHSLGLGAEADWLDRAVAAALADGLRPADIAAPGAPAVTTEAMGEGVIAALEARSRA